MNSTKQKTKILFAHYGEDWIRGSERCLLDLLTHIDRTVFQPVVWCNSNVMAKEVKKLGIEVSVDRFSILLGWGLPRFDMFNYLYLLFRSFQLIRRYKIDLVHSNSGAPCQWLVPISRIMRIPIVAHLHARYGLRERCCLALHHVSMAIGVSRPVINGLLKDGMKKQSTQVIHNGIDGSRLKQQTIVNCRTLINASVNEPIIVTAGSLIKRKGFDVLLKSINILQQRQQPVQLIIIGDGPERQNLQHQAETSKISHLVTFLGERSDVGGILLGGADLFVSTAREEVFGLVLAEAAWAGLPVIATNTGGIPEVIKDGETGLLVPVDDPTATADAIERTLQHNWASFTMGVYGNDRVHHEFSVERYVMDFQKLYRQLINAKQSNGIFSSWRVWFTYKNWILSILGNKLNRIR